MISIIVTVYNKEKFIENTLNSIINQTYSPSEIIIINDGSTDRSLEIINNIQLPNFAYVITTKNQGVSASRNLGLKKAKSKYIQFVDGDDILKRNAISIFLKHIKKHPNMGLYAANRITSDNKVKVDGVESKEFNIVEYFENLINFKNLCWTSAVVINKDKLEDVRFNVLYSHGEDRDFFIRILKKNNGYWINELVATYNNDPLGLSSGPINKKEDLYWIRFNEFQKELHLKKTFWYKLKYRFANIYLNLRFKNLTNIISWLNFY